MSILKMWKFGRKARADVESKWIVPLLVQDGNVTLWSSAADIVVPIEDRKERYTCCGIYTRYQHPHRIFSDEVVIGPLKKGMDSSKK